MAFVFLLIGKNKAKTFFQNFSEKRLFFVYWVKSYLANPLGKSFNRNGSQITG